MIVRFDTRLPGAGELTLQRCGECGHINYPPRELCGRCLADALEWEAVDDSGVVLSGVALHYSLEQAYTQHLPWHVASIALNCGPIALCHLQPGVGRGTAVRVKVIEDEAGNRMLAAVDAADDAQAAIDEWLEKVSFKEVSP